MNKPLIDILWVLICAALVFLMQAGFTCLESGLTRSKNSISIAFKNLTDLVFCVFLFWALGFALMFGNSQFGIIGINDFFLAAGQDQWTAAFFLFQVLFCCTSVTIPSGAVAERMRFTSYIVMTIFLSCLIYPVFGHWAWNGQGIGVLTGWLAMVGFRDFAGSSVVHSVGGWAALAALLVIGPRYGRFANDGKPQKIHGHNLPMSILGVMLLWFGWFGFNGGSTYSLNSRVPLILSNTLLAGATGGITALVIGWFIRRRPNIELVLFGSLCGLVSITASANAVDMLSAVIIGCGSGIVMLAVEYILERFCIDDAVGAVSVHLGGGIWGTLAVALFGEKEILMTGLNRFEQLLIQMLGIGICFIWTFFLSYLFFRAVNRFFPFRVLPEEERIGLNVSEHDAHTEILDLYRIMDEQANTGNIKLRVPVEPFTEAGQIAERYNNVLDALEKTQQKITKSLRGKELLLREVHHRVKNSLQVVCSLLNLQAKYVKDKESIDMFKESRDRVKSMALVHEKLYQSEDMASIDFYGYIKNIANSLFQSYGINFNYIKLKLDVENVHMGIDTAIPCGLIINELVTNCLKHAFPQNRKGEISIILRSIDKNRYEMAVKDNGISIPDDLDYKNSKSLGLQLVALMAESQLGGKLELNRDEGTEFKIIFHELKYKKRI